MRQWKEMQRSFVELVRCGTPAMVAAAAAADPTAVNTPAVHAHETALPVVEAVRRGDAAVLRALLSAGARLDVQATERTGGCGMETATAASPLAEALVARRPDLALLLVAAHPDLRRDPGYQVTSTFEGNVSRSVLDLARELRDGAQVVAAIQEKLSQ